MAAASLSGMMTVKSSSKRFARSAPSASSTGAEGFEVDIVTVLAGEPKMWAAGFAMALPKLLALGSPAGISILLGVDVLAFDALGWTTFGSAALAFPGAFSGGVFVDGVEGADGAGGALAVAAFGWGGGCFGVVAFAGAGCCFSWDAGRSGAAGGALFCSVSLSLSRSTSVAVDATGFELALAGAFALASGLHEGIAFSALHGVSACAVVPSRFKVAFSCFTGVEAIG
eukprot:s649_g12.t1